jgi:hypothetical protein
MMIHPGLHDRPPDAATLTDYDRRNAATYLRLLDAEADGADWREVVQIVLGVDPDAEPERAQTMHRLHLDRAHWMRDGGYKDLLKSS